MSDTVIIALIIAVVILAALIIFRKQLRRFFFKAGKEGIETALETREPGGAAGTAGGAPGAGKRSGVTVSGNTQIGAGNVIDVVGRGGATVKDNLQEGRNQKLKVRPDESSDQPKP